MRQFFTMMLLMIALLLLIGMGWLIIDNYSFLQRTPMAIVKGQIINVATVQQPSSCTSAPSTGPGGSTLTCSSGSSSCEETVQFETPSKLSIIITSSCYGGHHGDMVDVAYPVANPFDARVIPPGGFLNRSMFVVFGILLLVTGFAIWQSLRVRWWKL